MPFLKRILVFLNKSTIYLGSSLLSQALPFLLLPVFTKYLTPAEYGTLAIYQTLVTFAIPFVGMNVPFVISKEFFKQSKEEIAKLIYNIHIVFLGTTGIVLILLSLYLFYFKDIAGITTKWLFSIPLVACLGMVNQVNLTILRNQGRAVTYGCFEVSNVFINLIISVLLVAVFKWGWEGRAYATVISAIIIGILSLIWMQREGFLKLLFDRKLIEDVVRLSIPLIPYSLSAIVIFMSNRFFIDKFSGKTAVGIFSAAYSFAMIVTLVKDAVTKTWSPWIYKRLTALTYENKLKIVRATYVLNVFFILSAIFITFVSSILIKFMTTERYHAASSLIIWIALGNAVNGMYGILVPFAVNEGKTKLLAGIMVFASLINLFFNFILVKKFGPNGAGQASLLAFMCAYILMFLSIRKLYDLPWFKKEVFLSNINRRGNV